MMSIKKKIVFLTGTRADFGKIKSLIKITNHSKLFDVNIFVTGMHLDQKYGYTIGEIRKSGFKKLHSFNSLILAKGMENILANTIKGFSKYILKIKPDLIIVHGDRIEALAGSIVGSLNNILIGHIEGGEISGTIDESIRHAVSKMSHLHFVSNKDSAKRIVQLGEFKHSINIIGSPDLDLMNPKDLPSIKFVKNHYKLNFNNFAIAMFHPVTTEINELKKHVKIFLDSLKKSKENFILVFPNNDMGSDIIIKEYDKILNSPNFKVYRSLRFEYFLSLLYHSNYIIGNSSAGVKEAPYYGVPTINIGTRQNNRSKQISIINTDYKEKEILSAINKVRLLKQRFNNSEKNYFGLGNSDKLFLKILKKKNIWKSPRQKEFQDF